MSQKTSIDVQETFGGLEAIPDAFMFPTDRIDPMSNQPRTEFDESHIESIAASLRKAKGRRVGGSGLIHPLLVRWAPGAFDENGELRPLARVHIVAGENRFEAAKRAELEKVPVIVTDMTTEEAYETAMMENILRGDLSPEDEGRSFQYLRNRYDLSALGVAMRVYGEAHREGYVQSRLDLLRLNDIVRPLISQRADTMTAARRIQTIANEETQRELVQFMLDGGNFKDLNAKIQKIKGIVPSAKEERDNRKALEAAFPSATPARPDFKFSEEPEPSPQEGAGESSSSDATTPAIVLPSVQLSTNTPPKSQLPAPQAPASGLKEALDRLVNESEHLAEVLELVPLPAPVYRDYFAQFERFRENYARIQAALSDEPEQD